MTYYGSKELAAAFRTVRNNTIKIAEEIPESQYGVAAAPELVVTPGKPVYEPNEKISWGKLDPTTPRFVIESDATIVFPLVAAYVLNL